MQTIFVYGSLRKDEYNYHRFMTLFPGELKLLQTEVYLKGFELYSFGAYPGIVRSDNDNCFVIGDVLRVSDNVSKKVDDMELDAGYKYMYLELEEYGPIMKFYPYDQPLEFMRKNYERIESGDWSNYLKNKKENHGLETR